MVTFVDTTSAGTAPSTATGSLPGTPSVPRLRGHNADAASPRSSLPGADEPDSHAAGYPGRRRPGEPRLHRQPGLETGFAIQRSTDGVTFTQIATAPARAATGAVTFVDTTVTYGTTYTYRVADITPFGNSAYTNTAQVIVPVLPALPSALTANNGPNQGNQRRVDLTWDENANNVTGSPSSGRPCRVHGRRCQHGRRRQRDDLDDLRTHPEHRLLLPHPVEQRHRRVVRLGARLAAAHPHHPVNRTNAGAAHPRRPSFPRPTRAVLQPERTTSCSRRERPVA